MSAQTRHRRTPLQIVWFKRDLRISDNAALSEASKCGPVLPLVIIEPALWREPDASHRQYAFARECLVELDLALAGLGQGLIVRIGDAVQVLDSLRQSLPIAALWSHEETGNGWTFARDRAVAAWARAHGIAWHERRQTGVVRRLASRSGWAERWDREMARPIASPPRMIEPVHGLERGRLPHPAELGLAPDGCTARQPGGRQAAQDTLESFLAVRGQAYRRAMSSPLAGAVSCSRLSVHLAWGSLSLREATQATWARQRQLKEQSGAAAGDWRAALSSFNGRLHWHCHFMQKLESAPSIEFTELHPATRGLRPELARSDLMAAWAEGLTGFPFLDACMRSLRATGWINFRMRAMLVSFASYNLWQPWRETGLHLARLFTDYEPGIHWPQVQMQSGTTGINTIRIYNVVKQGYDQDPDGIFVRQWVPELAKVPDAHLQEPWHWDKAAEILGTTYPFRIVDLARSAKLAKDRIYGLRRGDGFRDAADRIQEKHGSRKSGLKQTAKTRRKSTVSDAQLKLDV